VRSDFVTFDEDMTIFRDPLAASVIDEDSTGEERWVTLGQTTSGNLLLVVHTCADIDPQRSAPILRDTDAMKDEYDFSKVERGKFYRLDAALNPPVHLDAEVLAFLAARAWARGISLSELVNALLKEDIELIEAAE
jgi:hypothetical protein